jgi:Tol biopolymer transport system component
MRTSKTRIAALVLTALLALTASAIGAAGASAKTKTIRVSVKPNGKELNNVESEYPSVSANGKFVSFESGGKFVKGDAGTDFDVFVRNVQTGKIKRASVMSNGKEASGDSEGSSISASGRYVAFHSDAALVKSDANGVEDVYVHDFKTGKTKRASVKSNGGEVPSESVDVSLSGDGRWAAWDSEAAFVNGDVNGVSDVYVHDMQKGKTVLVSKQDDGDLADSNGPSDLPSVSGDGRFVAFESQDQYMTSAQDEPSFPPVLTDSDIFVRDMKTGHTIRASVKKNGTEPDNNQQQNRYPAISADGRHVAFVADLYGKFVPKDSNNFSDIYVKNLKTGKITDASVKSNGDISDADSGPVSPAVALSGDGRYVAFDTEAALGGNDTNMVRDVYVHDVKSGQTSRASVKSNGAEVDTYPHQEPAISADGRWVGFASMGLFTGGDSGTDFDVFLRGPRN